MKSCRNENNLSRMKRRRGSNRPTSPGQIFFHSSYKEAVDELLCQFDRAYFSHRLALAGNNRERLAREIGISSRTLRDKLKACGLGHLIRVETGEVGSDSGDKE